MDVHIVSSDSMDHCHQQGSWPHGFPQMQVMLMSIVWDPAGYHVDIHVLCCQQTEAILMSVGLAAAGAHVGVHGPLQL